MKRILPYILLILLFENCSSSNNEATEDQSVFRYNEPGGISWLDPAKMSKYEDFLISYQLFNGLVMLDHNMDLKPCIAKSYTISSDGKVYTFNLRTDVQFHPSNLIATKNRFVNAEDVVYSFKRIMNPLTASPGKYIFNNLKDSDEGLLALNDSTVRISLKTPQPSFLYQLCLPYGFIVPSEVVGHYGDEFSQNIIGTGPFQLKSWKKDVKIVLIKNQQYFEKDDDGNQLPYLNAVAVTFLVDRYQELIKFKSDKLDMVSGLNEDDKDALLTKEGELKKEFHDRFYLEKKPWLYTDYIGILVDDSINNRLNNPLKIKKLRKAIGYAIDRKKLVKYLRNGVGLPAESGFVPYGMPGFDHYKVDGFSYNKDLALRLIAECNFEVAPTITLCATEAYKMLCEFLQKQIEELGVDVKIDLHSSSSLRQRVMLFESVFYRKSWVADFPEPINYLQLFYSDNFFPNNGYNYTHFKNETYDLLYEKAMKEQHEESRYQLYKKMQEIIHEEVPVIPLFYGETLRFYSNRVSGVKSNSMNMLYLKNVKIVEQ